MIKRIEKEPPVCAATLSTKAYSNATLLCGNACLFGITRKGFNLVIAEGISVTGKIVCLEIGEDTHSGEDTDDISL